MKCLILHQTRGRLRVHLACRAMSLREADSLEYYLKNVAGVTQVKVFDRTQDAIVTYTGSRADIVRALSSFSFTAPDALEGYTEKYIGAIENEIAEVIFSDEDGAEICLRKGVGTDDISGDYNAYAVTETKTVDGKTLTCKGNDGLVSNATWTDGTYAYSIMSTVGMTAEQLSTFVQSLS